MSADADADADADDDDDDDADADPKKSVAGLIDEKFRKFGDAKNLSDLQFGRILQGF